FATCVGRDVGDVALELVQALAPVLEESLDDVEPLPWLEGGESLVQLLAEGGGLREIIVEQHGGRRDEREGGRRRRPYGDGGTATGVALPPSGVAGAG